MQASSDMVRKAIAHVREQHPYWDRKDGADHFMVFSYDHGRCDMAPGLQHEEFGRMFAIQSYGDIMSMCAHMPSSTVCPQKAARSHAPANLGGRYNMTVCCISRRKPHDVQLVSETPVLMHQPEQSSSLPEQVSAWMAAPPISSWALQE